MEAETMSEGRISFPQARHEDFTSRHIPPAPRTMHHDENFALLAHGIVHLFVPIRSKREFLAS
ncbi:MAG: hypothetical protein VR75_14795 [Hyphomonadaceae bacterium BRH_c29]|nr:MAG: hypothetical protein VR75_14795 [Hyphomonadaceae bacterium BRH_c29]